jgi:hypothetical protein
MSNLLFVAFVIWKSLICLDRGPCEIPVLPTGLAVQVVRHDLRTPHVDFWNCAISVPCDRLLVLGRRLRCRATCCHSTDCKDGTCIGVHHNNMQLMVMHLISRVQQIYVLIASLRFAASRHSRICKWYSMHPPRTDVETYECCRPRDACVLGRRSSADDQPGRWSVSH